MHWAVVFAVVGVFGSYVALLLDAVFARLRFKRLLRARSLGRGARSIQLDTTRGVIDVGGFPEAMEQVEGMLSNFEPARLQLMPMFGSFPHRQLRI
jgi:hypothetical protein